MKIIKSEKVGNVVFRLEQNEFIANGKMFTVYQVTDNASKENGFMSSHIPFFNKDEGLRKFLDTVRKEKLCLLHKTIEMKRRANGSVIVGEKEYVLLGEPFNMWNKPTEAMEFVNMAICPIEGVKDDGLYDLYTIHWHPLDEWLAFALECERNNEYCNPENACDWEHPYEAINTGMGYDLDNEREV